MAQSATDLGCAPEDFKKSQNIIVESTVSPDARRYLNLPFICDLVSYGNNIVASVDLKYKDIVEQYINRFAPEHCFETPNMHILNDAFQAHGMRVCFMAEYFLPEYRRQGVAGALTSRLALEIIKRGKVPFYCCAWSNIKSAGNAIKSGFRPAWAELTVKPADFVDKLNGIKINR